LFGPDLVTASAIRHSLRQVIRLYRARFSTNVERVALALAYKGLEAESEWIEYTDRSRVEAVSGQGLVPVIDYDGEIVADSMEIVRFLEERHPQPPLFPREPERRAEVLVFVDWFNRVWKRPPNEIEAELSKFDLDRRRLDELAGLMRAYLDLFEDLLAGREHLMGKEFGAADIAAFPFLKYAVLHDPEDDELFHQILRDYQRDRHRPRLEAWIRRVDQRPRA
jgi:glutathione S-transferase